jgi:hypothetical protein
LSAPRRPVCCCSTTNATPWSISIQPLRMVISMGGEEESGSTLVPELE